MTARSIIVLLLLSMFMSPSFAVNVNLYEVEVPVSSQAAEARTEAARSALEQVLIRLVGDESVLSNPDIKENLTKAGYFVQEYRYALPSRDASQYLITIRFDPNDINRLLKRAGIAYWGSKRPLILVYIAIQQANGQLEVVGDDLSNDLASEIEAYSTRYGLPMILPAMDMEDLNQFSAEDISGMLLPTLKTAGKRYSPDGYLIGFIQPTYGGYTGQWQLATNAGNKVWNWSMTERTTDKMVANVIGQVSQSLSNRPAIKHVAQSADIWVNLEVSNVMERTELVQLVQYLKQLSVVRDVKLSQISSDSVKIAVLVRGTLDTFRLNAANGEHLILKGENGDTHILKYEWVR